MTTYIDNVIPMRHVARVDANVSMRTESRLEIRRMAHLSYDCGAFSYGQAHRERFTSAGNASFPGLSTRCCLVTRTKAVGQVLFEGNSTMRDNDNGADNVRRFNPKTEIHYAISQEAEFELRELFECIGFIGDLSEGQPDDQLADIGPEHLGRIFRTFSRHGLRIMDEKAAIHPQSKRDAV